MLLKAINQILVNWKEIRFNVTTLLLVSLLISIFVWDGNLSATGSTQIAETHGFTPVQISNHFNK